MQTQQTFPVLLAQIPTGNAKPWQKKIYALPEVMHKEFLGNVPAQVRAMIEVATTTYKGKEFSGPDLAKKAVELGTLKTKQNPDIIFAYYRRHLEVFGMKTVRHEVTRKSQAAAAVKAPEPPKVPAKAKTATAQKTAKVDKKAPPMAAALHTPKAAEKPITA